MNGGLDLKRILVFRVGHLGDNLVALPAYHRIRNAFPNAHIALLTNIDTQNTHYVSAQNVLPEKGLFDEYFKYPANLDKSVAIFGKLLLQLRRARFDALFYLVNRNRTENQIKRDRMFFRIAGIKNQIGTEYIDRNRLDISDPRPLPKVVSECDFYVDILADAGIGGGPASATVPDMRLSEADREIARKWLEENAGKALSERRLIGIAPGSKWESKIWPTERFAEVVTRLIGDFDVFPVIFGGSEDRDVGDELLSLWKTGANAAGKLSIRQAAAALKDCRFYLGNDTGTMHLAASVGTPCVAIFPSLDWEGRWIPWGTGHRTFRSKVECEGCYSPSCPNEKLCLTLTSAEDVYRACREVWTETAQIQDSRIP